jgi:hypothetical protein
VITFPAYSKISLRKVSFSDHLDKLALANNEEIQTTCNSWSSYLPDYPECLC